MKAQPKNVGYSCGPKPIVGRVVGTRNTSLITCRLGSSGHLVLGGDFRFRRRLSPGGGVYMLERLGSEYVFPKCSSAVSTPKVRLFVEWAESLKISLANV